MELNQIIAQKLLRERMKESKRMTESDSYSNKNKDLERIKDKFFSDSHIGGHLWTAIDLSEEDMELIGHFGYRLMNDGKRHSYVQLTDKEYKELFDKVEKRADESKKINESVDIDKLKQEIRDGVNRVFTSEFGFEEGEAEEYSVVEVTPVEDGYIKVEVRAEVSYDGLMTLSDSLDTIIKRYDKDAYFEPVDSGIIEAYIHN